MKVLVNCTTLVKGGAIQASVSFILVAASRSDEIDWHFALSPQVFAEWKCHANMLKMERVTIIAPSPAKNFHSRKKLKELELTINPDAVFTFMGPAYVKFIAPHLCGVADGWVTHSNWLAFRSIGSKLQMIKMVLQSIYKAWWYQKASSWVVEAECARRGLISRMLIPKKKVNVVKNTCAAHYFPNDCNVRKKFQEHKIRILTLSAYYPHKNLEIIPYVAKELLPLLRNKEIEFVITLPKGIAEEKLLLETAESLGVSSAIKNIGPVRGLDGPQLYSSCDIMFLPSFLETFSASYPEAMAMKLPIVTVNLEFARDICKDAALYYSPKDPVAAAKCIATIIHDEKSRETLTSNGSHILKELPNSEQKYQAYTEILKALASRN